jgi:hypothetical protein
MTRRYFFEVKGSGAKVSETMPRLVMVDYVAA